jgi:hypothetical protein
MRNVIAAITVVFAVIGAQTVLAEPMKCSGENKTCLTACARLPAGQGQPCLEGCRASQAYCIRSGCWQNGASRYCGLTKQ